MDIGIHSLTECVKGNTVLDNINLEMHSGTVYGLAGDECSGKTMLMRAICGLIHPASGYVEIDGKVIGRDISCPESVGSTTEKMPFIRNFTGIDNLKTLASIRKKIGEKEIRAVMAEIGLVSIDKRPYRKYPPEMKRKLGIAAAVMEHPDIILLDEPFNDLDDGGVTRVKRIIRNERARGALIIIACRNTEELYEAADQFVRIEDGAVKEITPCGSGLYSENGGIRDMAVILN